MDKAGRLKSTVIIENKIRNLQGSKAPRISGEHMYMYRRPYSRQPQYCNERERAIAGRLPRGAARVFFPHGREYLSLQMSHTVVDLIDDDEAELPSPLAAHPPEPGPARVGWLWLPVLVSPPQQLVVRAWAVVQRHMFWRRTCQPGLIAAVGVGAMETMPAAVSAAAVAAAGTFVCEAARAMADAADLVKSADRQKYLDRC